MKIVFFTLVDDHLFYPIGAPVFINSFKKFHPDIPLVVFRQDMVDKVFKEKGINFYTAKPTFAKLLIEKYDLVVNIDSDHVICSRLDKILEGDFDVAAPSNFNDYENMSISSVTEKMYLQGGLVASTNKVFWDVWESANKEAHRYHCWENDTLNLIWYENSIVKNMKRVVLDEEKDYYGCKSLNREAEFYIEGENVMCRGEKVYCYHHAKGGRMPKLRFDRMPFTPEVRDFLTRLGTYGQSTVIEGL